MGNLEERKGGTLWEKEGTLRIPCGNLVGTIPQGSGLLPQGTEGDGGNLVAIFGNIYQEKEKILVLTDAERETLLGDFRSYLEGDGRAPHLVHEYATSIGIFLLRGHDPRSLDQRELEARYLAVYPGRELVGARRTALRFFLSFLRGVHDGVRRLPPLPTEW